VSLAAPVVAKVLESINRDQQALVDFASQLIATTSDNPPGNELAVARVAEAHLRALGLTDIRILGPSPERANLVCRFSTGRPGSTLLLNGHLDTKPAGPRESWVTDPFQGVVKDGRLYGLGAVDMKGPDAALVYGLKAVLRSGAENLQGEVLLVLSADEEGPVVDGARYLVQEAGITADAALIAEPCGVDHAWESIPLFSRGLSCMRFFVKGTQTHSSVSDRRETVNASLMAARLLVFLDEKLALRYPETPLCRNGPTVNLGATLKGGQAYAIVSGDAEFTLDIRTLPGMNQAQLAEDFDLALSLFRKQYPKAQVSYEFFPGRLGWTTPTEISPDLPLVKALCDATKKVLGKTPPFGYFPAGTDAIWWQGAGGIPTIAGFGPGLLFNCHQPNEWVEVCELVQASKIYALTILNFLTPG
jgi:acetylornithine deacetylase/succinyl-diaminopimelate desuccinylase-like protein